MTIELKAQKREKKQPIDERKEIKGIIYGKEIKENTPLLVDYKSFSKLYDDAGKSTVFSLNIDGEGYDVLIKDVQYNLRNDLIEHIDFYAIVRGEEMEVEVALEFIGESKAVKDGGILNTQLSEVVVKCLPRNIPQHIEIDLSDLKTENDVIRLENITLPKDVSFLTENLDEVVVSVMEAVEAEDEIDDADVEFNDGKESTEETKEDEKK